MEQTYMKEKPILPLLLSMALPMVLSMMVNSLYNIPSLMISLCRYAILILPLAFLLSRLIGPSGVWHAFWICEAITAGISYAIYRQSSI